MIDPDHGLGPGPLPRPRVSLTPPRRNTQATFHGPYFWHEWTRYGISSKILNDKNNFVQRNPLCQRKVERTRQKIDLESRSHETAKVSSEIRDQVVPLLSVYWSSHLCISGSRIFLNICWFPNFKNCELKSDVCLWSWFLIFEFLMRSKREVENWSANMNNLPTSAWKICSSCVQSLYSVVFELLFHNSHISIFIGHAHRTYKTGQENQNSIILNKLIFFATYFFPNWTFGLISV